MGHINCFISLDCDGEVSFFFACPGLSRLGVHESTGSSDFIEK